ncbi:dynein-1-beta heavy chain, flagellar inner arm I1 complex [Diachasma alloeum]|uniref:dynein-1-beta heavy chain, flagellar inner arm I1 complex n=1 Tax=Diachasma alloeum TaxID=454923 RepID=UPI00073833BC|nr:dynein-1-beta heavy chain, flagellar inner arm I1 complex [Diachasma alloeum]
MATIRADSIDPKKIRKGMEKAPPPVCRDYLDMDTDEEEFGRQETPEPDEELPPEPEKPVFTDEELERLVQCVKDLTIIPSDVEFVWPLETIERIQEYFHNPGNTILTIFFEATECKALLDFPLQADQGLTYFLRSPWQVYTPENFMSTVIFGNFSGNIENSMLKFLEIMYSPIAVHSDRWPEVMRDEIFSDLNQFLMKLTDATYGPMGLTILHVPREGIQDDKTESLLCNDKNQKGFIERLERVARYWIKQIRGALEGTDLPPRPTCGTIMDEIEFWNYRFENLSCLHHQLNDTSILTIVKTLKEVDSSSVQQFHPLTTQVHELVTEASSNVMYLNLFVDSCTDFEVPNGIEAYSTKILHQIRFVGLDSKFYTSADKIDTLCRALGTQIIEQCKSYVNLDTILEGDVSEGKKMLENSINCCQEFLQIFERLSQMDARCQDLIEFSDARFVYDTCEEVKMIGGARGMEHELQYKKIEESFSDILEEVKEIRDFILDVTTNIWLDRIVSLSERIQNIDNMVKNLIHEIFKDVQNIEEGIEALYAMKRFATRRNLQETIRHYWTVVWKIFESELKNIDMQEENILDETTITRNAEAAMLLRIQIDYLSNQFNIMINASDWLGDSNVQERIIKKYKQIQSSITEKENSFFSLWERDVQSDVEIRNILKEPVLAFLKPPDEVFLTVNMDESYIQNMREVIEWKYLKYDSKAMNSKFLQKWQPIKLRYMKIKYLCDLYNSIVKRLHKEERLLLENAINEVKNSITPALPKCTWAVENIDKIYAEWLKNIILLKDVVEVFTATDAHIRSSCEDIAKFLLIKGTDNVSYTLEQFKEYLELISSENSFLMKESSKSILSDLYVLHRKAKYGESTPRHWTMYVTEVIGIFKRSLIRNVRGSLMSALKFFRVASVADSEPLFHIEVNLSDNNLVSFSPDLNEIGAALNGIIPVTTEYIYSTDEFTRILKFGAQSRENDNFIHSDGAVRDLTNTVEQEIKAGLEELEEFRVSGLNVERLSKIDDIVKSCGQENVHKEREQLESTIRWCEEILEMANALENKIRIRFVLLNTENLKIRVLTQCENMKDTLFVELSRFIASELALQRMPVQNDNMSVIHL